MKKIKSIFILTFAVMLFLRITDTVKADQSFGAAGQDIMEHARAGGEEIRSGEWMYVENAGEDGTITVVGYMQGMRYEIEVPSQIDGKTVTRITERSTVPQKGFYVWDTSKITKITLPNTIEYIGDDTFKDFSQMTEIVLPNNMDLSVEDAFEGCSSLKTVTLISDTYMRTGLEIEFPDSRIETLNYHEGVKNVVITASDLSGLDSVQTVNLPSSTETFSAEYCGALTALNCPKALDGIKFGNLTGCKNLHIEIQCEGFYNYSNSGITKITLDLSGIGKYGNDEQGITDSRYEKTFLSGCDSLQEIQVKGSNEWFFEKNGALCWRQGADDPCFDLIAYPAARNAGGNFVLDEYTRCIYWTAFAGSRLACITIPENITPKWYYDEGAKWIAEGRGEGYWEYGRTFLTENNCNLRLVPGSNADTANGSAENFAGSLSVAAGRIAYYLGNEHTISYRLNGGTNAPDNPSVYRAGEIKVLKDPARAGYEFLGWKRNDVDHTYVNTTELWISELNDYNNYHLFYKFEDFVFTAEWKAAGKKSDPDNGQNTMKKPSVPKVNSFKAKAGKKKLALSWKKVSGAAGYQIQISTRKNFKGAKVLAVSKSKNKYTRKGLKAKKKYYVRIRACKTYRDVNGKTRKVYGKWVKLNKRTK